MDEYETTPGVLNVAETCCDSISIRELASLSSSGNSSFTIDTACRLTYGEIRGSSFLRQRVADLCNHGCHQVLSKDDVLITQGAINANFLVFYSMIEPNDHIICVYPTYQQLYSVPASLGAEISFWKLREEAGNLPDIGELEGLVKTNTKVCDE